MMSPSQTKTNSIAWNPMEPMNFTAVSVTASHSPEVSFYASVNELVIEQNL